MKNTMTQALRQTLLIAAVATSPCLAEALDHPGQNNQEPLDFAHLAASDTEVSDLSEVSELVILMTEAAEDESQKLAPSKHEGCKNGCAEVAQDHQTNTSAKDKLLQVGGRRFYSLGADGNILPVQDLREESETEVTERPLALNFLMNENGELERIQENVGLQDQKTERKMRKVEGKKLQDPLSNSDGELLPDVKEFLDTLNQEGLDFDLDDLKSLLNSEGTNEGESKVFLMGPGVVLPSQNDQKPLAGDDSSDRLTRIEEELVSQRKLLLKVLSKLE